MFKHDPNFGPWGPFIRKEGFLIQPLTQPDFIAATCIFVISGIFACTTAYLAWRQTKRSREAWRSAYIWMIWLEWSSNVALAIISMLNLVEVIRPSFYFYFGCLFTWIFQTHCLLQIIVNRIRIILQDRAKGKRIMIFAFVYMALINISVFCVWIPARMQISMRWIHINDVWDRIEKVLYLAIDLYLNVLFIRTVKANLIRNGLSKYERLVKFNISMIGVSLLMDIVIIAAMSIPNGFVYVLFHPFAYLVKLNIEMSMARLIKKIALGSNATTNGAVFPSFNSTTEKTSTASKLNEWASSIGFSLKGGRRDTRVMEIQDGVIKRTEEFTISSVPKRDIELQPTGYGAKGAQVSVNRVDCTRGPQFGEHGFSKDNKGLNHSRVSQVKEDMSDEEDLIKSDPVITQKRRSLDSSTTHSMASTRER